MSKKLYFLGKGVLSKKGKKDIHQFDLIPSGYIEKSILEKMVEKGTVGDLPKDHNSEKLSELQELKKQIGTLSARLKDASKKLSEAEKKLQESNEKVEELDKAGESIFEKLKETEKELASVKEELKKGEK